MNTNKKLVSTIMAICITLSCSIPAFADEKTTKETVADMTATTVSNILVEYGYPESTAKVLPEERQRELAQALLETPESVDVSSTIMEVDNLAEIEAFFTYTDEQLADMGADPLAVVNARKELGAMYEKSAAVLAKELDISDVEASMIQMAIKKGNENANSNKSISKKSGVNASGSIASSKITYTQSVQQVPSHTTPYYLVDVAYAWKTVYATGLFDDNIGIGWGGNLNTIDNTNTAYYYKTQFSSSFTDYYATRSMSVDETPNMNRTYTFPQSIASGSMVAKTKEGYASLILYQTKTQGFDSKVVSRYGHKLISLTGVGISFNVVPISVEFSTAFDQTEQKSSNIRY